MRDHNDTTVLVLGIAAAVGIVLCALGLWFWFGFLVWLSMVLSVALGYGPATNAKPVRYTLLAALLAYAALFAAMVWTDHPGDELQLALGLPISTSFLVYGIWPLGALWGVLYFRVFDRCVLPEKKLDRFFAEFGRRK